MPGGLGSSVGDPAGFTWDLGGPVVFSHFGEFDRLLAELFTAGELLHHDRSSYIRFRDRWVPCPFQQHLHHLPAEDAEACAHDLLLACRRREQQLPADADFATWLQGMYGSSLVERFFGPDDTFSVDQGIHLLRFTSETAPARLCGQLTHIRVHHSEDLFRDRAACLAAAPSVKVVPFRGEPYLFSRPGSPGPAVDDALVLRRSPDERFVVARQPCASCATSGWSPSRRPRPDRLPGDSETPERAAGQAPHSVPAQILRRQRCRGTAVPGPAGLNTQQLPAPPRCGQAGPHRRACGITGCGQPSRSAVSMNRRNIPCSSSPPAPP
ncbi:hypothetical protein ACF060_33415 [Streptomyces werraensis]|uniref:hypothetical protein n=1 Tax=Streptomyces werraensis TaxID=68284 RepID=UPI0036FF740C